MIVFEATTVVRHKLIEITSGRSLQGHQSSFLEDHSSRIETKDPNLDAFEAEPYLLYLPQPPQVYFLSNETGLKLKGKTHRAE
jgi:hypothetical protein